MKVRGKIGQLFSMVKIAENRHHPIPTRSVINAFSLQEKGDRPRPVDEVLKTRILTMKYSFSERGAVEVKIRTGKTSCAAIRQSGARRRKQLREQLPMCRAFVPFEDLIHR